MLVWSKIALSGQLALQIQIRIRRVSMGKTSLLQLLVGEIHLIG